MNYIYDILINFQPLLIDSYEWNKEDEIIHIRKMPLIKIETDKLLEILKNQVKFDSEWIKLFQNKTEVFTNKKIEFIKYACLLSDGLEVVALRFNENGIVKGKSSLLIEEAIEAIEYASPLPKVDIKYEVIGKNKIDFKTRREMRINNYIIKELQKVIKDNNQDKLNYLYLECFGHKYDSKKPIEIELIDQLNDNFDEIYLKIYNFFKMTTSK